MHVEAAQCGATDSVFFAPERPNVTSSNERVSAADFIKINPKEHNDVVRVGDDFEISFVGMSVSTQDLLGDNELMLCSLARKEDCLDHDDTDVDIPISEAGSSTVTSTSSLDLMRTALSTPDKRSVQPIKKPGRYSDSTADSLNSCANCRRSAANPERYSELAKAKTLDLADLPTSLPIRPGDLPFVHYDPETDGHDSGSKPNTFIPIPATKRLFVQKRGSDMDMANVIRDVVMRFTIMEIDKLSEEQMIAVKSLGEVAKSVGKASTSVPYLKFISWLLKFANMLGRSALKKVARPDHVLSTDMSFMLAADEDPNAQTVQREEYGNYLRVSTQLTMSTSFYLNKAPCTMTNLFFLLPAYAVYFYSQYGYYFFLSGNVDAKLYAQTGASSQNVQLLLRRFNYNAKLAKANEKEFFPLTGMSYTVVKVTRGCSPYNVQERSEMFDRHRGRLMKLLKKYSGPVGSAKAGADLADHLKLLPSSVNYGS